MSYQEWLMQNPSGTWEDYSRWLDSESGWGSGNVGEEAFQEEMKDRYGSEVTSVSSNSTGNRVTDEYGNSYVEGNTAGTGGKSGTEITDELSTRAGGGWEDKYAPDADAYSYDQEYLDWARENYRGGYEGAQGREAAQMEAQQVDPYWRDKMQELYGMYGNMASGGGPSLARQQLQAGMEQALAGSRSAALATGGLSPAAAMRSQQMAQQGMANQVNQQAAMMRSQEQMQAMGAMGQLSGMGSQLDYNQAGLNQQASMANMQAQQQQQAYNDAMEQYYFGAANTIEGGQAGMGMQAQGDRSQFGLGMYGVQAGLMDSAANRKFQEDMMNQNRQWQQDDYWRDFWTGMVGHGASAAATLGAGALTGGGVGGGGGGGGNLS